MMGEDKISEIENVWKEIIKEMKNDAKEWDKEHGGGDPNPYSMVIKKVDENPEIIKENPFLFMEAVMWRSKNFSKFPKYKKFVQKIVKIKTGSEVVFSETAEKRMRPGDLGSLIYPDREYYENGRLLFGRVRNSGWETLFDYLCRGRLSRGEYPHTRYTLELFEYDDEWFWKNERENERFEAPADISKKKKIKEEIENLKRFLEEVDPDTLFRIEKLKKRLKRDHKRYEDKRIPNDIRKITYLGNYSLEEKYKNNGKLVEVEVRGLFDEGKYTEATKYKIEADKLEVMRIYDYLIKPFKSQAFYATQIGKAIKRMCDVVKERGENVRRMVRLARNDETGYASDVKEWVRKECEEIYEGIDLIESFLENFQQGLYLTDPPLHVGRGGEDVREFEERSYSLLDHMFHRIKRDGKEEYVNANEFRVDGTAVRFYRFSSAPDPNYLGDRGYAIEIVNNGDSRFLDKGEAKRFVEELRNYTLFTIIEKYG
ncbi:MAG: hypothetical protein GXO63_02415 [Candidatus Micrarchaeota archaeon]|nr:hypothetical protein [Candidatus Micrarchaeota archaeon]